jgi:hypothetical protein
MQWIQVVKKYANGNNYNLLPYGGGFESHVELVDHVIFFWLWTNEHHNMNFVILHKTMMHNTKHQAYEIWCGEYNMFHVLLILYPKLISNLYQINIYLILNHI